METPDQSGQAVETVISRGDTIIFYSYFKEDSKGRITTIRQLPDGG